METKATSTRRNRYEVERLVTVYLLLGCFLAAALGAVYLAATVDDRNARIQELEQRPLPRQTVEIVRIPPPVVVTVTPPPVKVTVTAQPRASSVSRNKGGSSNATLKCIRQHESGGNYQASNPSGKFQGAYQMHRDYAPTWAKRAGHGSWAGKPVASWPPAVQDAVALKLGQDTGWGAWSKHTSYRCPGF